MWTANRNGENWNRPSNPRWPSTPKPLYLLDGDRFDEARPAPDVPGTVEYAHWSPDGGKVLLGVAGLGADLSRGQGSGTYSKQVRERPAWFPEVEDGTNDAGWRSLWVYTVATGELAQVSPAGLNCWEAGWCGPGRVATIRPAHRGRTGGTPRT
ncbi:hypothetical protein [Saccharopolyspora pogona]|uniref:hypothetical protein n=1 Tax=Saccharopolyspora pogona TaxID=333966 RepID=UPI00168620B3|nr:hypothetical protein [Saccharopolyspora pogona]